ncbi:TM2 domain-containing protein [Staphylococcus warneri]|nr:TM2 domain-containing protein [Staphylococcus warneri]
MSNIQLKKDLSSQDLLILQTEMDRRRKKKGAAFALWWFTGVFGGHRFYTGDIGYALGLLFTLGGLGIWAFIDIFFIFNRIDNINDEEERKIMMEMGLGQFK